MAGVEYNMMQTRDTNSETQNALLTTALALGAYRLEHGACPATLGTLAPRYMKRPPPDAFARVGFLRYRRQGNSFTLYSVGPDGRDDGGTPIFDPSQPTPQAGERDRRYQVEDRSKGDLVAGVNDF